MPTAAPGPFELWAPRARRVELVLFGGDGARLPLPLRRGEDGWHRAEELSADARRTVETLRRGDGEFDYAFRLDGGEQLVPDPRALRLPSGVHGPARTFDASAHEWKDSAWRGRQLAGSVIYELHVGTFTSEGTLDAAIGRLDHLAELGIDAVELLPVAAFNGEQGWGYDGVAWFAVHEPYGGPAAYQRFVDAAHQRGLAVVQDVVYNHFGPSGNYSGLFGPYLQQGGTGWGDAVNLDGPGSDEVRALILDNAAGWFRDFHVDGLRLDAVHALRDARALTLLEELARRTAAQSAQLGRPLALIAESDRNDPALIRPLEAGGVGLDGQWSDDFHHAVHVALSGEADSYYSDFAAESGGVGALAKVLRAGWFHDGGYSSFRERHHGRPLPATTPAWRLVVCIQNHDQVGNRAAGDRFGASLSEAQLLTGAVLLLTAPFTPMLFMGEEWGATTPFPFFTSHPEPELAEAVRTGRLREFERMGWDPDTVLDPQAATTFAAARLDWSEPESGRGARLLAAHRRLIALRRELPELGSPWLEQLRVWFDAEARWIAYRRGGVVVAANLGDRDAVVPLAEPGAGGRPGTADGPGAAGSPGVANSAAAADRAVAADASKKAGEAGSAGAAERTSAGETDGTATADRAPAADGNRTGDADRARAADRAEATDRTGTADSAKAADSAEKAGESEGAGAGAFLELPVVQHFATVNGLRIDRAGVHLPAWSAAILEVPGD